MAPDYKIKHDELKPDCVSITFVDIKEELRIAKEMNDLERVKRYEALIRQGEEYIPICKGPYAPDYCDYTEITTCKGCKYYRSYD